MKTTFDINCSRIGIMRIVTAKDTLIIDIRICRTIVASANRAANNSRVNIETKVVSQSNK